MSYLIKTIFFASTFDLRFRRREGLETEPEGVPVFALRLHGASVESRYTNESTFASWATDIVASGTRSLELGRELVLPGVEIGAKVVERGTLESVEEEALEPEGGRFSLFWSSARRWWRIDAGLARGGEDAVGEDSDLTDGKDLDFGEDDAELGFEEHADFGLETGDGWELSENITLEGIEGADFGLGDVEEVFGDSTLRLTSKFGAIEAFACGFEGISTRREPKMGLHDASSEDTGVELSGMGWFSLFSAFRVRRRLVVGDLYTPRTSLPLTDVRDSVANVLVDCSVRGMVQYGMAVYIYIFFSLMNECVSMYISKLKKRKRWEKRIGLKLNGKTVVICKAGCFVYIFLSLDTPSFFLSHTHTHFLSLFAQKKKKIKKNNRKNQ